MRALVLEDHASWVETLSSALAEIEGMNVEVTDDVEEALQLVASWSYDIVTVDVSLIGTLALNGTLDAGGMEFLSRLRRQQQNVSAAILLITGRGTLELVRSALVELGVDDFIDKATFDNATFPAKARRSIFHARVRAAERRGSQQHQMTLSFSTRRLVRAELTGPKRKGAADISGTASLDHLRFGKLGDELNRLLVAGDWLGWRRLAHRTGLTLYNELARHEPIAEQLVLARDSSVRGAPSLIAFDGPAVGLRVPFELVTNVNDYLSLEFVIFRKLTARGLQPTTKGERFHEFVRDLVARGEPLRVLAIGVDSDGTIPAAEEELDQVVTELRATLRSLGIQHAITTLTGGDASYANVAAHLSSSEYHMLHYAGHGLHEGKNPEKSGVVLGIGAGRRILTATDFKVLLTQTPLRFVYLSCCLGAATARRVASHATFGGTLESIVRADVPFAVSHRWTVPDDHARTFAVAFYRNLLTSFSPGMAILAARIAASTAIRGGRDSPLWASPVLVARGPV